ncbi:MAG: hypothetical protein ROW48_10710 [Bellilinea sp.]
MAAAFAVEPERTPIIPNHMSKSEGVEKLVLRKEKPRFIPIYGVFDKKCAKLS